MAEAWHTLEGPSLIPTGSSIAWRSGMATALLFTPCFRVNNLGMISLILPNNPLAVPSPHQGADRKPKDLMDVSLEQPSTPAAAAEQCPSLALPSSSQNPEKCQIQAAPTGVKRSLEEIEPSIWSCTPGNSSSCPTSLEIPNFAWISSN